MEVENRLVRKFLNSLEDGTVTMESIDEFGSNIDSEGLKELFLLVEAGEAPLFALKVYSMVYDEDIVAEVNKGMAFNMVDMTLAGMWNEEAEDADAEELKGAALGFGLIGTDLVKRIKNGYRQLGYDLKPFELQLKSLVESYQEDIDNGVFLKSISQQDDEELTDDLMYDGNPDFNSVKEIRDRIIFSNIAFVYNESDSVKERQSMMEDCNEFTFVEEDLYFLETKYLSILNDIRIKRKLEEVDISYINDEGEKPSFDLLKESAICENDKETLMNTNFNEENDDDLLGLEVMNETTENSLFKAFKKVMKPKEKSNNDLPSITMPSSRAKKPSATKFFAIIISIVLGVALFLTVVTQQDKTNDDSTISEKVVENEVDNKINKNNFKINRSGTNEAE